jgi:hypothetical protein
MKDLDDLAYILHRELPTDTVEALAEMSWSDFDQLQEELRIVIQQGEQDAG